MFIDEVKLQQLVKISYKESVAIKEDLLYNWTPVFRILLSTFTIATIY